MRRSAMPGAVARIRAARTVRSRVGRGNAPLAAGGTMVRAATVLVGLVALLHLYILVLEMFLWDRPAGIRAFGHTREAAQATKVLAANQGLYNGFLAAGLLWGLWLGPAGTGVKVFFLVCVIVAGVYGAVTASRKILFVQALPAAVALAFVLLA